MEGAKAGMTLGPQQTHHKEWISIETLSKIETRRKLKEKINSSKTRAAKREAQSQYNKANQEVRKNSRRDKRKFGFINWVDNVSWPP